MYYYYYKIFNFFILQNPSDSTVWGSPPPALLLSLPHVTSIPFQDQIFSLLLSPSLILALSPRCRQSTSHPCRNAVIPSPLLISLATTTVAPSPHTTHYTLAPMELPHSRAVALPPPVDTHYACTTAVSFSPPSQPFHY